MLAANAEGRDSSFVILFYFIVLWVGLSIFFSEKNINFEIKQILHTNSMYQVHLAWGSAPSEENAMVFALPHAFFSKMRNGESSSMI